MTDKLKALWHYAKEYGAAGVVAAILYFDLSPKLSSIEKKLDRTVTILEVVHGLKPGESAKGNGDAPRR